MTSDELLKLETAAIQSIDGELRGPALKAAARIRELEAALESKSRHLKNATTLRNSDFNELWREIKERDERLAERDELLNGVTQGTHVIVPVEPTDEMLNAARDWACGKYGRGIGYSDTTGVYRAMIRAAQPGASD